MKQCQHVIVTFIADSIPPFILVVMLADASALSQSNEKMRAFAARISVSSK
jgi:hypothetical protein